MKKGFLELIVALLIIGAITLGAIIFTGAKLGARETVEITVNEKLTKRSEDSDRYLIFTDNEVFENTDEFFIGKWNSSDVYAQLKVGESYRCDVYGWRNQFFSWYRNIINCEEVEK